MTLGENLQRLRKEKGLSQEDVARALFVSRQTISKWENDLCLPDLENFRKICHLYQVDFNEILGEGDGIESIEKESEKNEEELTGQEDITEITEREQEVKQKELTQQKEKTDLRLFCIPFFSVCILVYSLIKTPKKRDLIITSKKTIICFFINIIVSFAIILLIYLMFPAPNITTSVIY